jgi:hypothetical protein
MHLCPDEIAAVQSVLPMLPEAWAWAISRFNAITGALRAKLRPTPFHQYDCEGPADCGGDYVCAECRATVGWCFGAADDMPDACDACWVEARPEETA